MRRFSFLKGVFLSLNHPPDTIFKGWATDEIQIGWHLHIEISFIPQKFFVCSNFNYKLWSTKDTQGKEPHSLYILWWILTSEFTFWESDMNELWQTFRGRWLGMNQSKLSSFWILQPVTVAQQKYWVPKMHILKSFEAKWMAF